jgi:hypothetical protein
MYTFGGLFIIGGSFTSSGGVSTNNIAFFTGVAFFPMQGGMTGGTPSVNDLFEWKLTVFAGGTFTSPGNNIARWGAVPIAPVLLLPEDAAQGISVTPTFTWLSAGLMYEFRIQIATDANFTNIVSGDSNIIETEYTVPGAEPLDNNTVYFWRVRASNGAGTGPYSLIRFFLTGLLGVVNQNEIPGTFSLYQNYPNPFNPVTKIKFDLPRHNSPAKAKINLYDISGRLVSVLLNTDYAAGKWELDFDASDLASGIYLYRIEAGPYVQTNKMILLK